MKEDSHDSLREVFLGLIVFSAAMAFLESAVVIYLRKLYYPCGFSFPIVIVDGLVAVTEVARELATLIMLVAVSFLAGGCGRRKFAVFFLAFGVWDLFYYFWLWLFLGWPSSLLLWDVLFLIPVPWLGPVLAPCLVSLTMILISAHTLWRQERKASVVFKSIDFLLAGVATIALFLSFTWNFRIVLNEEVPTSFPWFLFLPALGIIWGAYLCRALSQGRTRERSKE